MFNSLRQNNRLFCVIFFFKDSEVEEFFKIASAYLNISVFGPKKAIINGTIGDWEFQKNDLKPNEHSDPFWNETDKKLLLGDFNSLAHFLIASSGKKDAIEVLVND